MLFVADSRQEARFEAEHRVMLEDLRGNPWSMRAIISMLPFVIQYNKRDMPNAMPVDELRRALNERNVPDFEAVAVKG